MRAFQSIVPAPAQQTHLCRRQVPSAQLVGVDPIRGRLPIWQADLADGIVDAVLIADFLAVVAVQQDLLLARFALLRARDFKAL